MGLMQISFDELRLPLLDVLTHELLTEGLSQARDTGEELTLEKYDEVCYAELVGNETRSWIVHILDFTEEEVVDSLKRNWEAK